MMEYKGYRLEVHPTWTQFGSRICFINGTSLTITKATGSTPEAAIEAAKRWVDYTIEKRGMKWHEQL